MLQNKTFAYSHTKIKITTHFDNSRTNLKGYSQISCISVLFFSPRHKSDNWVYCIDDQRKIYKNCQFHDPHVRGFELGHGLICNF